MGEVKRIWATVSASDAEALEQVAGARGLRSSDLLRETMLGLIGTRAQSGDASQLGPIMTRLDALADKLEQKTQALQVALDVAYASDAERKDVREALTDIAMAIGVLAGSIEPMGTDNGGPF